MRFSLLFAALGTAWFSSFTRLGPGPVLPHTGPGRFFAPPRHAHHGGIMRPALLAPPRQRSYFGSA